MILEKRYGQMSGQNQEMTETKDGAAIPEGQSTISSPVLFYNDIVIEHFTSPHNVGELQREEADGFAVVGDPACGDQMKLWIKVEDNIITDIRFKSFGCPGAIATSSMTTDLALGRTLEDAASLTDDEVIAALGGIPENKKHCSLLGITALQQAINDCLLKRMIEPE